MSETPGAPRWILPAPFDGTVTALREHARAITALERGERPLWLGPFAPPERLPAGFERTALVVPTSGSTGGARAVALTRAALVASQDATARALGGHGLWLPLLPPTHIAGIQVIARAVRAAEVLGRRAPLLPERLPDLDAGFTAAGFARLAAGALDEASAIGAPAFTSLVPTQLRRLLEDGTAAGGAARAHLARFTAVLVGGARTEAALLAQARAAGIAVRTTYGSSETAGGCVYDGEPLVGTRLRIEDGRLRISSPSLATGYLRPDGGGEPIGPSLLTSDLARWDAEGRLEILGRADDVIISGGRKVHPVPVERALLDHPVLAEQIAEAAVLGLPDPEWGERVVALVVPRAGRAAPTTDALRAALRGAGLPAHALPREVIAADALPLLGIGKIDRSAARRLAARTSPAPHRKA